MQPKLKRLMIGATAFAVAAGGLMVANNPAQAAPGDPAEGSVSLPAVTTPLTTVFAMNPNPAPGICDGNTSSGGYRWQTFITPLSVNPGTLIYTSSGPTPPAGVTGLTSGLLDNAGNFIIQRNTSAAATITPIPGFNLSALGATLTPGEYNIGFACTLAGVTTNFWTSPITVTATNFTAGVITAPVLNTLTPGNGTLAAAFTQPAGSDPAVSGYTVTATPQGGGAAITATGATSPITVTGLTNGTTYDVTVTGTSGALSAVSNTLSAVPAVQGQPAVQNLAAIPGAEICSVSWNAPAGLAATNYTVVVLDGVGAPITGSPFTVTTPLELELLNLNAGEEYDITVTANYPAPDFGTPDTVSCIPNSAQLIIQEVSVVRPPGALILTQRCGVFGALPVFNGSNTFPGFVTDVAQGGIDLPLEAANGVFPGGQPTLGPDGTGGVDPEFGVYPNPDPASYPTYCDLDLGTAKLVTQGNIAGYYQAEGRLNQVSVLDTRDGDLGWGVTGTMGAFDDGFGVGFEGSYLGWDPEVADTTVTAGYTQTVTAGPTVLPGTGIPGDTGLGDGETLATALPGQGLGVAVLDARILLLVPPTVPAGTYEGDLTLSFL